jgi:DNA polymerase-3 subunit alpha
MTVSLEQILDFVSRSQKERSKGQLSFFDLDDKQSPFKDTLTNLPAIKEWPEPQILAFEKEMLGFYVSGHPLARYAPQLKRFTSTLTSNLSAHTDGEEIKIVGLIAKIKHTVTRAKQEKMAIIKLEDLEGAVEILVFPRTFQKVSAYLLPNSVIMVKGALNLKEDTPKIIVNDLFPVEQIYKLISNISINLSGIQENLLMSLKSLLETSRGNIPVYLHLGTPAKSKVQLVVGEGFYIEPTEQLIFDIENLLGQERLSVAL